MAEEEFLLVQVGKVDLPEGLPSILVFEASRDISEEDKKGIQQALRLVAIDLTRGCGKLNGKTAQLAVATNQEYPRRVVAVVVYPWEGDVNPEVLIQRLVPYFQEVAVAA